MGIRLCFWSWLWLEKVSCR